MACYKAGCRKTRPEIIAKKQRQTRQPVAALSNLAQRECHNRHLPTVLFSVGASNSAGEKACSVRRICLESSDKFLAATGRLGKASVPQFKQNN
jgi:hypothetical protein